MHSGLAVGSTSALVEPTRTEKYVMRPGLKSSLRHTKARGQEEGSGTACGPLPGAAKTSPQTHRFQRLTRVMLHVACRSTCHHSPLVAVALVCAHVAPLSVSPEVLPSTAREEGEPAAVLL